MRVWASFLISLSIAGSRPVYVAAGLYAMAGAGPAGARCGVTARLRIDMRAFALPCLARPQTRRHPTGRWLVSAVGSVVVAVVLAAGAALDLQGRVVDAEAMVELVHQPIEECVVVAVVGADQVRGHRDLACAQRPDVQVVHRRDARLRGEEL